MDAEQKMDFVKKLAIAYEAGAMIAVGYSMEDEPIEVWMFARNETAVEVIPVIKALDAYTQSLEVGDEFNFVYPPKPLTI